MQFHLENARPPVSFIVHHSSLHLLRLLHCSSHQASASPMVNASLLHRSSHQASASESWRYRYHFLRFLYCHHASHSLLLHRLEIWPKGRHGSHKGFTSTPEQTPCPSVSMTDKLLHKNGAGYTHRVADPLMQEEEEGGGRGRRRRKRRRPSSSQPAASHQPA